MFCCFSMDGDSDSALLRNSPVSQQAAAGTLFKAFGHSVSVSELTSPARRKIFAERRGFEPRKPFWSLHAFQACLFNHSSISPSRFQAQNSISATKLLLFLHIRKSLCKFLHIFCYFMPKSCRALALVASIISSTDTFKTCASRSATSAMKRLSFRSPL